MKKLCIALVSALALCIVNAEESDLVVVGSGGAGLSAAVAATDLGASVIIVEKEGYVGGNTLVSGGIFNAPDPEMQKDVEMTAGVTALVETALAETRTLLDKAFDGSVGLLVNTLIQQNCLTQSDLDGLYEILRQAEEGEEGTK